MRHLERISKFAESNNSLAFVVADDCSPAIKQIARKVSDDYRRKGAPYGFSVDLSPISDTIHCMHSSDSLHIQMCDLALYAIRRFEAHPRFHDPTAGTNRTQLGTRSQNHSFLTVPLDCRSKTATKRAAPIPATQLKSQPLDFKATPLRGLLLDDHPNPPIL